MGQCYSGSEEQLSETDHLLLELEQWLCHIIQNSVDGIDINDDVISELTRLVIQIRMLRICGFIY